MHTDDSLQLLNDMCVRISVAWIPGHAGIFYNERADTVAREALYLKF